MKNAVLVFLSSLLLLSCTEKKTETNTHLSGTIKGFSNGMLYLKKISDTSVVTIDSLKVESNIPFQFDFNLESPEMIYLVVDRGVTNSIDNELPIFAEPGTINVETELKYFYANAKITGSKNHELYDQFQKINTKFKNEELIIAKEKYDATRFNRTQDIDSIDKKLSQKTARKYLYAINFAMVNKDKEVAPYVVLTELTNVNYLYLDSIQKTLTPKVAQSKYGKLLTQFLLEKKENK